MEIELADYIIDVLNAQILLWVFILFVVSFVILLIIYLLMDHKIGLIGNMVDEIYQRTKPDNYEVVAEFGEWQIIRPSPFDGIPEYPPSDDGDTLP